MHARMNKDITVDSSSMINKRSPTFSGDNDNDDEDDVSPDVRSKTHLVSSIYKLILFFYREWKQKIYRS